jgi:hypothetical protein
MIIEATHLFALFLGLVSAARLVVLLVGSPYPEQRSELIDKSIMSGKPKL